jgi:AcrR family transcriptional regulator
MARDRAAAIPLIAEVFREHGYEGASLSLIAAATGLGKGSLYNFFPGGKEEMAAAVLAEIDAWFATHVFEPLRRHPDPPAAIEQMFQAVDAYFRGGGRVCLVGVFALGAVRDRFATAVRSYFAVWAAALTEALARSGRSEGAAAELSEEILAGIQGALVLSRALDDPGVFSRTIGRLRKRVAA